MRLARPKLPRCKNLLVELKSSNLLVYAWLRKGSKRRLDARCWSRCGRGWCAACDALCASSDGCGHRRCNTLSDQPCWACSGCHANFAKIKLATNIQGSASDKIRWQSSLRCLNADLCRTSLSNCARDGRSSACWGEGKQAAQDARNVTNTSPRRNGVLFLVDRRTQDVISHCVLTSLQAWKVSLHNLHRLTRVGQQSSQRRLERRHAHLVEFWHGRPLRQALRLRRCPSAAGDRLDDASKESHFWPATELCSHSRHVSGRRSRSRGCLGRCGHRRRSRHSGRSRPGNPGGRRRCRRRRHCRSSHCCWRSHRCRCSHRRCRRCRSWCRCRCSTGHRPTKLFYKFFKIGCHY